MPGFIENLHHFVKKRQDGIGKNFVIEVGIQLYDFDFRLNFILKSRSKSNDSLWIVRYRIEQL